MCRGASIAVLLTLFAAAWTGRSQLMNGWAMRMDNSPELERFKAKAQTGIIYVIDGNYSAKNIIARFPMDPTDNIGSIYRCMDKLAWRKGFCAIPEGGIYPGKHMELKRRGPQDAGIYIAGQKFDR